MHPIEIEGDSQILITMATQLLNGARARQIASSWRLEARLEIMEGWLQENRALLFKHTRREGNKVADLLANLGVDCGSNLITGALDIIQKEDQRRICHNLIQREANPPDAGASVATECERTGATGREATCLPSRQHSLHLSDRKR